MLGVGLDHFSCGWLHSMVSVEKMQSGFFYILAVGLYEQGDGPRQKSDQWSSQKVETNYQGIINQLGCKIKAILDS